KAGRYALQVLGRVPPGIRPPGAATLEAIEKNWEMRPVITVQFLDEASRQVGRVVLRDYATDAGDIGVPADARALCTVGAAQLARRPQPYSPVGPPWRLELLTRPNLLGFDALNLGVAGPGVAYGTSLAAPFAAGIAASCLTNVGR